MASSSQSPASQASNKHSRSDSTGYELVHQDEEDTATGDLPKSSMQPMPLLRHHRTDQRHRISTIFLAACVVILLATTLYLSLPYSFTSRLPDSCPCRPPDVPQYFQTSPQLWAGPTATGAAAFLAQTRTFDPEATYVPNAPLQTSVPIEGAKEGNRSIFEMMGYLSPYAPSPGFGVDEYPLPPGAEIVQVQMLSRHGARYPTSNSNVQTFGEKIAKADSKFAPKGDLEFLKNWKYQLGGEILVPKGRQELFDSGT